MTSAAESSELETTGNIEEGMFRGTALEKLDDRLKCREYDLVMCVPECGGLGHDGTIHIALCMQSVVGFARHFLRSL